MVQCRTKTTNSGLTTWPSWRNRCTSIPDTPVSITLTSRYDADDSARAAAAEQLRQNRERRCPSGEYASSHPFASFDGGIEEGLKEAFVRPGFQDAGIKMLAVQAAHKFLYSSMD
jgi:hypothetical protein